MLSYFTFTISTLLCLLFSYFFSSHFSFFFFFFFFFNDTATTEIYTLSLHDALPISPHQRQQHTYHLLRRIDRDVDVHRLADDDAWLHANELVRIQHHTDTRRGVRLPCSVPCGRNMAHPSQMHQEGDGPQGHPRQKPGLQ